MAERKRINLALQGGGAHGAFTWGVLDRLLEEDAIEIAAISGTSAGAMNATAFADGIMRAGREGARENLAEFWHAVAKLSQISPPLRGPLEMARGTWNVDASPMFQAMDTMKRVMSPYQLNPLDINPVRDVLTRQIDFERVRSCDKIKLFVSATNVRTGRLRVFEQSEMTPDAVMASAAIPHVYQAVEVDGEAYWDGGFMGNPPIFPLIYASQCADVAIVQINPIERETVPKTPTEIAERVNEISFNSSLLRELRAMTQITELIDRGELDPARHKRLYLHRIPPPDEMLHCGAASKMNAELAFLEHLKALGRASAAQWLDCVYPSLGKQSTLDFQID